MYLTVEGSIGICLGNRSQNINLNCKCRDKQFHFNPQDDMIKMAEQVVIIRRIQVVLLMTNPCVKDKSK